MTKENYTENSFVDKQQRLMTPSLTQIHLNILVLCQYNILLRILLCPPRSNFQRCAVLSLVKSQREDT